MPEKTDTEVEIIRHLVEGRLKVLAQTEMLATAAHLDEDTTCAFVEGRLGESESSRAVSHLVACAVCRRTTAQLIRFESQTDSESEPAAPDEIPGRLRQIFESLTSHLSPSNEEVFAYQNPPEDPGTVGEPESTEPTKDTEDH